MTAYTGERQIDGHAVDWEPCMDTPEQIGVWVDSEPIGWITGDGPFAVEAYFGGGADSLFRDQTTTFDAAVQALYDNAATRGWF